MKITVTQKNIDQGTRSSIYFCAVALAVKQKKGIESVSVGLRLISVKTHHPQEFKYITRHYRVSNKMKNFIEDFDKGKLVTPSTFTVKRILIED